MKSLFAAIVVAALAAIPLSSAEAQVTVGFGIQLSAPYHHPRVEEVIPPPPCPDAVWVRGHWSWDEYDARYIWVEGHWRVPPPPPVPAEPEYRHVPRGEAWGWWRNHEGYDHEREHHGHEGHGRFERGRGEDDD